jgi:hypothetical protein
MSTKKLKNVPVVSPITNAIIVEMLFSGKILLAKIILCPRELMIEDRNPTRSNIFHIEKAL